MAFPLWLIAFFIYFHGRHWLLHQAFPIYYLLSLNYNITLFFYFLFFIFYFYRVSLDLQSWILTFKMIINTLFICEIPRQFKRGTSVSKNAGCHNPTFDGSGLAIVRHSLSTSKLCHNLVQLILVWISYGIYDIRNLPEYIS